MTSYRQLTIRVEKFSGTLYCTQNFPQILTIQNGQWRLNYWKKILTGCNVLLFRHVKLKDFSQCNNIGPLNKAYVSIKCPIIYNATLPGFSTVSGSNLTLSIMLRVRCCSQPFSAHKSLSWNKTAASCNQPDNLQHHPSEFFDKHF